MKKKPNIRDVAELANASPATISRVINGKYRNDSKVRKRVEVAIEQTGYIRKNESNYQVISCVYLTILNMPSMALLWSMSWSNRLRTGNIKC